MTNDAEIAEEARRLRTYGERKRYDSVAAAGTAGSTRCKQPSCSRSSRSSTTGPLDGRRLAERYDELLADVGRRAPGRGARQTARRTTSTSCARGKRDELRERLASTGWRRSCTTRVRSTSTRRTATSPVRLPVSERLCDEVLSLPLYPELRDDEVERVAEALSSLAYDGA